MTPPAVTADRTPQTRIDDLEDQVYDLTRRANIATLLLALLAAAALVWLVSWLWQVSP